MIGGTPIKFAYQVIDERGGSGVDLPLLSVSLTRGVVPRAELADDEGRADDLADYKVCKPGDIVINRMSAYQGALGLSLLEGLVSPDYMVLRPNEGVSGSYLTFLFKSKWFVGEMTRRLRGIGSTEQGNVRTPRINPDDLGLIKVGLPKPLQQRAIADYLDRETTRIDALITKKLRMIELLQMRLVSESTANILRGTRGTRTTQSRTGFYGLVPADWKETSLRHLGCEVQTGPFGSQLHAEEYVEGGWPIVNPQNLVGGRILPIANMCVSGEKRQDLSRHILRLGDIVFGRRGEMGRAGLVTEREAGWLCGTGSLRLRLVNKEIVPEYFLLLLQTEAAKAYFQLASVGSTMENLNSEILLDFPMLVPSVSEQGEIVIRMAELGANVNTMNTLLKEQVRLLIERRAALITAAVMGELEIPGVAA